MLPDYSGQKFGMWMVMGPTQPGGKALCQCACGMTRLVQVHDLVRGASKSCGCLNRKILRARNLKHGDGRRGQKRPEYSIWVVMRDRCLNPRSKAYENYGGRGITVCERWASYENFIADMGLRPSPSHSLDRIDNNKGYSPENCRWATDTEQARNKRTNHRLTVNGITATLEEWSERTGIAACTIRMRVSVLGWSEHDAVTKPVQKQRPRKRAA